MSLQNVNITASESEESSGKKPICAQLIPASVRHTFFPGLFGCLAYRGPLLLTHWMQSHCQDYAGGYWEYFDVDNETGFAVPGFEGKKHFRIVSRRFSGEMSAEAAGVSAMLSVMDCLIWKAWSKNGNDPLISKIIQHKNALWEYALTLEECRTICLAVA